MRIDDQEEMSELVFELSVKLAMRLKGVSSSGEPVYHNVEERRKKSSDSVSPGMVVNHEVK